MRNREYIYRGWYVMWSNSDGCFYASDSEDQEELEGRTEEEIEAAIDTYYEPIKES